MGVSASHIDWTMIPYVRKSFWKHYKVGIKYLVDDEEAMKVDGLAKPEDVSINDSYYNIFPKAKKYALDMTLKEVYQAVEGLFHNLNSLQSRSGRTDCRLVA